MLPNLTKFKELLSPLYDSAEARSLYYMVLTELLDCDMTTLLLRGDQLMTEEKVERFDEITQKLCGGQPIQHILGYALFHGNRFFVNPNKCVCGPIMRTIEISWQPVYLSNGSLFVSDGVN